MASQLENTSAILGEYMLKGWTLTDLHCAECRATPLMREPLAQANAAGRVPIQFCAQCDGRPDEHPQPAYEEPSVLTPESPTTPPAHHAATHRADPDAAADAISELLLKGYSLLGTNCPDPACAGIPLVGYPRRRDGAKDPRRECVSCGTRYVDEKDVESTGMRLQQPSPAPTSLAPTSPAASSQAPPPGMLFGSAASAPSTSTDAGPSDAGGESPRSRMRREMYEQGAAMNAALAQKKADAEKPAPARESLVGPVPSRRRRSAAAPYARPFVAADHRPADADGKFRVVLIGSGSVASVKIPLLVEKLKAAGVEVQVVATRASLHFFDKAALERGGTRVWEDADEWADWKHIGEPILHIELRRWADLVAVVPTSADMLAKLAAGICDSLATSLLRATPASTPVILCPAMNTVMYEHPLTARQEAFVRAVLGYYVLGPQQGGKLACGDVGAGKMTEWGEIADAILACAEVHRKAGGDGAKLAAAIRKGAVRGLPEPAPVDERLLRVELPQRAVFEASWRDAGRKAPSATSARHRAHALAHEHQRAAEAREAREHQRYGSAASADSARSARSARSSGPGAWATFAAPLVGVLRLALLPLLLALHAAFTASSVALRLFQAAPPALPELEKPAPGHVALILVPGAGDRRAVAERYVESVKRAVQWAAEWGTPTLSVWDGQGLGARHAGQICARLLSLPPSPPSSDDGEELRAVRARDGDTGEASVVESVFVSTASGPRTVTVVFLPPSAGEAVTRVARRYAHAGRDATQAALDADVRADLALPSDPDLVLVHHLAPAGFWRGLLPRPAPELHGFPAWVLRIAEIYHHPPPLPLYVPFVGGLLQNSPLAILRKLGGAFPRDEAGVLDQQTWEGAQNAWERVEQRRGK